MAFMTRISTLSTLFFVAFLAGVAGPAATPASAEEMIHFSQPDPAAEDEIEALKRRIGELERQLQAARETIAILRRQLAQQGVQPEEVEVEDPLVLPQDQPLASPEATLAAVIADYAEFREGKTWDDEKDRRNFLREVDRWTSRMEKEYRGRVEWTCDMVAREQLRSGEEFLMVVVRDLETGNRWSNQFEVAIPRRLQARAHRIPSDEPIILRGTFQLDLSINPERLERGSFDSPRFVGPFVEFGFNFDVSAIAEVEREDDEHDAENGGG